MFRFIFVFLSGLWLWSVSAVAMEQLSVAALEKFEPYSWRDDNGEHGIDVEITREAARRAGFEIEFSFVPWDRVLSLVKLGKVDAGSPAFRRPEREAYAYYTSVPLHVSRYNAFTTKESIYTYRGIDSLFGLKVAKLRGFSIGKDFDDAEKNTQVSVREIGEIDQALEMLLRNRFDVFINNDLPTLYWAKQLGVSNRINMSIAPINPGEGSFLIFSKEKWGPYGKDLRDKFDKALQEMLDDGTIQAIIDRYVR